MAARLYNPVPQVLDENGRVGKFAGGKLRFFENGTFIPKDVFSDVAGSIPIGNEVTLDAEGRWPNFFGEGEYRLQTLDNSVPAVQLSIRDDVVVQAVSTGNWNLWSIAREYDIEDIAQGSDDAYYKSNIDNNIGNDPVIDLDNWSKLTLLEVYTATKTYDINFLVVASDGNIYRSKIINNLNNEPTISPVEWGFPVPPNPVEEDFPQIAHGLAVGDPVQRDAGAYVLADADTLANAQALGIVSAVGSLDNFTLQSSGYITGLPPLTANVLHYVAVGGGLTTTKPAISKPMLFTDSTTSGWILPQRPLASVAGEISTSKGWVNFNGQGVIAIRDSYNVSGILDAGTGDFDVLWDIDFTSTDYCLLANTGTSAVNDSISAFSLTVGQGEIRININGSPFDPGQVNVAAFGQLI